MTVEETSHTEKSARGGPELISGLSHSVIEGKLLDLSESQFPNL